MHPFARLSAILPCFLLGCLCACAPDPMVHRVGGTIRLGDSAGADVPATVEAADESAGNDAADAPDEATEVDVPPVKPVDVIVVPDVEAPDAAPEIAAPDVVQKEVAAEVSPPDATEKDATVPDTSPADVAPDVVAKDTVAVEVAPDVAAPDVTLPDVVADVATKDTIPDTTAPVDVVQDKVSPPDIAPDKVTPPDVAPDKIAPPVDACSPKPEICDGIDNDCDGLTDEEPASSLCDDGNPCTVGEACVGGACSDGLPAFCDDANPCTNDSCVAGLGCVHKPNALPCDADGSVCTVDDHCSGGTCVPGAALACDDANACTTDFCFADSGCAHAANQDPCSDGDACTPADFCKAGACSAGAQMTCSDANPCTLDSCSAGTCQHAAVSACVTRMQTAFGGAYADSLPAMRALPDGGFVLAGSTDSFGNGNGDIFLVRTDSCGNALWMRTFGGTGKEKAHGMALTPDGGFIIVGESASDDLSGNAYVIKTDGQGNRQWSVTHGGPSYEWAESVVATSDGGYVITSKTYSFGPNTPMWHNSLIFKLDGTGKVLWSRVFGAKDGSMDPIVIHEVQKAGGQWDGYLMLGGSEGFGQGHDDVWLMKLKVDGSHEWSVVHGSPGDDNSLGFVQTPDMGYVIASDTNGFGATSGDAFLLKTDVAGKLLWANKYSLDGKIEPHDIVQRSDGVVVTGFTTANSSGGIDAFLLAIGLDGTAQWMRTYGGMLDERGFSVVNAADGGLALAGDTLSGGAGGYDGWLVKTAADGSTPCESKLVPPSALKTMTVVPVTVWFTPDLLDAGVPGADTTTQGSVDLVGATTALCACQ